jgi:excisionase family DNA binding protein
MDHADRMLLRAPEVAEVLGLSRSRVYELLSSGDLPVVRIGSCVRVPVDALRRWIDGHASSNAVATPTPRHEA